MNPAGLPISSTVLKILYYFITLPQDLANHADINYVEPTYKIKF